MLRRHHPSLNRRIGLFTIGCLAALTSVGAQVVSQRLPQPTGDASLKGVVTDGVSGKVVPRVRVAVLGTATVNTTTDDQGVFEIANLPAGVFSLLVDVPGRGSDRASGITLAAGQHLEGLKLRSWPRASVDGRVTTPDGVPVSGATVEIARRVILPNSFVEDFRHELVVDTDADGRYHAVLSAGHYLVTVRSTNVTIPASVQDAYHQEIVRPSLGALVHDRLDLSAAPVITGRGIAKGEFRYQVMALHKDQVPAPPDAPATTYRTAARRVDLHPGEVSSVDFHLDVVRTFSVSGVVEGPVNASMVTVRLTSLAEPAMMQFSVGPPLTSETAIGITDAKGAFTILGVPAGRYEAFIRLGNDGPQVPGPQRVGTTASARREVTVDGDVRSLVLTLRPTPTVTGHVEFVGDPPPTAIEKARMRFGLYEELLSSTPKPLLPLIRADGSFQFTGEVPGRYWPTADLGDWSLQHITINGESYDDRIIVLGDEGLSNVTVVAERWNKRPDVLWGTVNLEPGTTPLDLSLAVFPTDYAQRFDAGILVYRRAHIVPLLRNQFNLGAMPAGDYYLVAYHQIDGQDPTRAFLDRLARHAIRVTKRDGQPTKAVLSVTDIAD